MYIFSHINTYACVCFSVCVFNMCSTMYYYTIYIAKCLRDLFLLRHTCSIKLRMIMMMMHGLRLLDLIVLKCSKRSFNERNVNKTTVQCPLIHNSVCISQSCCTYQDQFRQLYVNSCTISQTKAYYYLQ